MCRVNPDVYCIKDFSKDIEETTPRELEEAYIPYENYLEANYSNTMNNQVFAADYITGRGIAVPGEGEVM